MFKCDVGCNILVYLCDGIISIQCKCSLHFLEQFFVLVTGIHNNFSHQFKLLSKLVNTSNLSSLSFQG